MRWTYNYSSLYTYIHVYTIYTSTCTLTHDSRFMIHQFRRKHRPSPAAAAAEAAEASSVGLAASLPGHYKEISVAPIIHLSMVGTSSKKHHLTVYFGSCLILCSSQETPAKMRHISRLFMFYYFCSVLSIAVDIQCRGVHLCHWQM